MLEGKLVRLRAMEPTDAERAYKWINDREVTQYLMARYPMSLAAEQEWVAGAAKPNDYGGCGWRSRRRTGSTSATAASTAAGQKTGAPPWAS